MSVLEEWENVGLSGDTIIQRLAIPEGWIYLIRIIASPMGGLLGSRGGEVACFVPKSLDKFQ